MLMEPDMNDTTWKSSPLSAIREPVTAPDTLSRARSSSCWSRASSTTDGGDWSAPTGFDRRGPRRLHRRPPAIWSGSEPVRSYRSGAERGWLAERIYAYWQGQVGMAGRFMIDPQQHADTLFQVARRVGALGFVSPRRRRCRRPRRSSRRARTTRREPRTRPTRPRRRARRRLRGRRPPGSRYPTSPSALTPRRLARATSSGT